MATMVTLTTFAFSSLLVFAHISSVRCITNDILGLDIPADPELDANTVCKTFPDLTPGQYDLCTSYPDVAAAAFQGIQLAIHECQRQFRSHRWNCSSLETKNRNPHSSLLLRKGYRETAFAYAITAAGMVTQISHACSMGKLPACGCVPKLNSETGDWLWHGCENNIGFSDYFTRRFLDSREARAQDLHSQVNLHNNKAGRLILRGRLNTQCKCHGMSGSCEMKTCWKVAPPFGVVGDLIKRKYDSSTKVENHNSAHVTIRTLKRRKQIRRRQLIHFEKSPNYCEVDPLTETYGTVGRYCNRTTTNIDNCETLCCGRGYNTLKVTRTERCNCRFHWCCYVVCEECTKTEWVTVCK